MNSPGCPYMTVGRHGELHAEREEFYEDHLRLAYIEATSKGEMLEVDLDGTEGYATSFLDEAFGRLAEEFGAKNVLKKIEIISVEEPDWIDEIKSYILDRNEN